MRFMKPLCLIIVCATLAFSGPKISAQEKLNADDIDRFVKELSNWGRWGKDDQLGALNLITNAKRKEAAKLVMDGVSVSLARYVETKQGLDNPKPFVQEMLLTGAGTGQFSSDKYSVAYHGFAHTHMDSLCHLFYKGKMYNGFSRSEVTDQGAQKLSIHNVKKGIMTRGILIDIPAMRGVRFLEPGTAIYPKDLDDFEEFAKLKVRRGDVVFINTGRWQRRDLVGPWSVQKDGLAGFHASCAKWLKEHDIAMVGSDAALDVIPSQVEGVSHPVHVLMLHSMGVHIFDNCDFTDLCKVASEKKRWEFLLTASPIPVRGGTGSPLNPIATY
ncbi:MAG: cyclase [Planctomycetaceae bacterium]|nr:cyclase [Planctomycetaceae bacterium]